MQRTIAVESKKAYTACVASKRSTRRFAQPQARLGCTAGTRTASLRGLSSQQLTVGTSVHKVESRSGRGVSVVVAAGEGSSPCVLQFVRGVDEMVVPEVKLTRSRDGSNGVATFIFSKPTIFDNDADIIGKGEITGLYMIDEEGELQTTDVLASFLDGKPNKIEAKYVMKSAFQWDRFMRFMERYANANGLAFNKA